MTCSAHFSNVRKRIYTEPVFSFFSQCFGKQRVLINAINVVFLIFLCINVLSDDCETDVSHRTS